MSIAIQIDVSDTSSAALKRLNAGLQPAVLSEISGGAGAIATRTHLRQLNRERPNKLGGRRTNFYSQAAEATNFTVQGESAIISIVQRGIRQRFYGGTIKPKRAKYLTIPVHPAAHGKTASQFDLEVVFGMGGRPIALATKGTIRREITQTKKGKIRARNVGRRGEIYFRLVKSVTQQPDPTVLPPPDRIYGAAISQLNAHVDSLVGRARRGRA